MKYVPRSPSANSITSWIGGCFVNSASTSGGRLCLFTINNCSFRKPRHCQHTQQPPKLESVAQAQACEPISRSSPHTLSCLGNLIALTATRERMHTKQGSATHQAQWVGLLNIYASFPPMTKDTKIGIVRKPARAHREGDSRKLKAERA